MFREPGITTNNYVSSMCSRYHQWFVDMGYPRLDLNVYDDGEWEIIEYLRIPIIPSLTPWHRVLMDIRNTEINPWFCKKYVENLDLEKRYVWDEQDHREEQMRRELFEQEVHVADFQKRAFAAVKNNPGLMDRIARNGPSELSLQAISRHIPNFRFRKDTPKRSVNAPEHAAVCHRPEPVGEDRPAGVATSA